MSAAQDREMRQVIERDGRRYVEVDAAVSWLMHSDRLDEIPGACWPGLVHNPLWDAGVAFSRRFGGTLESPRGGDA